MASMFFKMAAILTNFHHIPAYRGNTVVILIAIPRFWGSRNPVEQSFKHKNALKCTFKHKNQSFNHLSIKMHLSAHDRHFVFQNGCQSNRSSTIENWLDW